MVVSYLFGLLPGYAHLLVFLTPDSSLIGILFWKTIFWLQSRVFLIYKLRLLLPKEKFLLLEFYHANAGLK